MARLFSGAASEAIRLLEHGLRLNPYDAQNFVWYNALGLAHRLAADAHKARESALRALKVRPNWRPTLETLVWRHMLLGDLRAAHACVEEFARLDKPAGDVFGPLRRRNPRWAAELAASLRKAGWRESMTGRS